MYEGPVSTVTHCVCFLCLYVRTFNPWPYIHGLLQIQCTRTLHTCKYIFSVCRNSPWTQTVCHSLFSDNDLVYCGPRNSYTASDLKPVSLHSFYLRTSTEGDDSPFSRVVSATTAESGEVWTTTEYGALWERAIKCPKHTRGFVALSISRNV